MFSSYFPNKNYTALYLHVFADKITDRLVEVFSGAFLYSQGLPLPLVLLFYSLEFGLRGALAPIAPVLASKIGIRKSIAVAYTSLAVFFVIISLANNWLSIAFISFIFHSLARAIYYPCMDTLHSVFVQDGTRGKQYSLEVVLTPLAVLIAVGIGSAALTSHFIFVAIALAIILVLALLPLFMMDRFEAPFAKSIVQGYTYFASNKFKENYVPLTGYALAIIANLIVVPLFIFTHVGSVSTFSFVILTGLLFELLFTLLYGKWIDTKGHKKTITIASTFQAITNTGFMFISQQLKLIPFLTGLNSTAWNMYSSNYNTRIQQKADKSNQPLLFTTAVQMSLCFVEIVALSSFALIALKAGSLVFPIIFISSIIGLFLSTKYFKD